MNSGIDAVLQKGVRAIVDLYRDGEITPEEVVSYSLQRIEELSSLNVFITVFEEEAIEKARLAGERWRKWRKGEEVEEPPPLTGIPVAVKDNILVRGYRTTCASRILENFIPSYTATAVERLIEAGAILIGKTNMDEFAMGSSNENSAFGAVSNPIDPKRVPGGSSGGSAVAVASNMVPVALGTDTGGSIRQPASFCGVVGMKPTYGRVSRLGIIAFASSLDQIGPLTKNVDDAYRILTTISGKDPLDDTSLDEKMEYGIDDYVERVRRLRGGLPREYFCDGLRDDVRNAVLSQVEILKEEGVEIEEVSLPLTEYAISTYYLIATAEASSNLSRYDGIKYGLRIDQGGGLKELYRKTRSMGFGWEVKRRIMLGTFALSEGYLDEYYGKAQRVRALMIKEFDAVFEKFDFLITPTCPSPAFLKGEKIDDPIEMYLSDRYTVSANLAGIPAISIPCGLSREGLPIGLQILGKRGADTTVLRVARFIEEIINRG